METFSGRVNRVIYYSRGDSGYKILEVINEAGVQVIKGYFPCIHIGFVFSNGTGETTETDYGPQLIANHYTVTLPDQRDDYINYLAYLMSGPINDSGNYDDINSSALSYAEHLYESYGFILGDYQESDETAVRIRQVNLEDKSKISMLIQNYRAEEEIRAIAYSLSRIQRTYSQYARPIYDFARNSGITEIGLTAIDWLNGNPYVFCDWDFNETSSLEERGYTFDVADKIARHLNYPGDGVERCEAAVLHYFKETVLSEGHLYDTEDKITTEVQGILNNYAGNPVYVETQYIHAALNTLLERRILYRDQQLAHGIYPKKYFDMECYVAEKLCSMTQNNGNVYHTPNFNMIESQIGLILNSDQREAITAAMNSPVSIITGGPGTGKTTIVKGLIAALKAAGLSDIMLAAPTGKAAVRMREATGVEAKTIHSMLEIQPRSTRRGVTPISCDAIIIDESSMIDIDLMDKLLYSIRNVECLVFVGDVDQLPSIGPGYVFHDMIESNRFNVRRLTQVYRQGETSAIVRSAHRIANGEAIERPTQPSDFQFIPAANEEEASNITVSLMTDLPEQGEFTIDDIQILCPIKDRQAGKNALNQRLQEILHPAGPSFTTRAHETIRDDDRVMHTRNDYTNNVFNGEISHRTTIRTDESERNVLNVDFDYGSEEYSEQNYNTDQVELAYAITVHKSQGSEFPAVVMPVFWSRNLYRNLIYTAMTRARERLYLVGSWDDLLRGIENDDPVRRRTKLKERIEIANSIH